MPILTFSGDFVVSQFSLNEDDDEIEIEVGQTPFLPSDIVRIEIDDRDVGPNGEFDPDLVRFRSFTVERDGIVYEFGVDSGSKIKESGGGSAKEQGDTFFLTNDAVAPPSTGPFSGLEEQTYFFSSETSFASGPGEYEINRHSSDAGGAANGNFNTASAAVCFAAGTGIQTAVGLQPVEHITVGTRVRTIDGGYAPVRHVLKRTRMWPPGRDKDKPILIAQGALGAGLPSAPLTLSPQHKVLMPCPDGGTYLTAARHLCGLRGVRQMNGIRAIEYVHLVLDHHAILFAQDTPSESFYPGPVSLRSLSVSDYKAVEAVFDRLGSGQTLSHARPIATGKTTRHYLTKPNALWSHQRLRILDPDACAA